LAAYPIQRLLALLLLALPASAAAEGGEAVQERRFRPLHELTLGIGWLPSDPYTKGLAGSVGYTLHLSDRWAWRVAEVGAVQGFPTNVRKDLTNNFAIGEERFREARILATSELMWEALYGRESFLNRGVLSMATIVSFGPAVAMMREGAETTPNPGVALGLGWKLYVAEGWALRLEARDVIVVNGLEKPDHVIWLSMAGSYALGSR